MPSLNCPVRQALLEISSKRAFAVSKKRSHRSTTRIQRLILQALDDPFIRLTPETRAKLLANPRVVLVETRHGGHCAFLSLDPGEAGYWAEKTLLDFLLTTVEG